MAGKKPASQYSSTDNVGSVYSLTDAENNVSNVATDITGKLSTQLSSYSDYSYLVTPKSNNPDALIFAKTLPGLTQGKRLTSTSATISVDAHANDKKPTRLLSLSNENAANKPNNVDQLAVALNESLGDARGRVVSGEVGSNVPLEQLRKFYHSPPSDYRNQNFPMNPTLADPLTKKVTKTRASVVSNNNNRRFSQSSVNSKASEGSQFYYYRNLRNLPSVKEEKLPEYTANIKHIHTDSSSSSGSSLTGKGKHTPKPSVWGNPESNNNAALDKTPSKEGSAVPKKKTTGCFRSKRSSSSEEDKKSKKGSVASSKGTTAKPHPPTPNIGISSPHVQFSPNTKTPATTGSSSEDESSENETEKSSKSKRTSENSADTATTATTATTARTATTDKSSSQGTSGNSRSTETSKGTSGNSRSTETSKGTTRNSGSTETSKGTSGDKSSSQGTTRNSGSTDKSKGTTRDSGSTETSKGTSLSHAAGGGSGGGGGKKSDDDHHHHHNHNHHKKSSSSEESSEEESSSEEERHHHKPVHHSTHQMHSSHNNVHSSHSVHSNKCNSGQSSKPGSVHSHPLPKAHLHSHQQHKKPGQEGYMSMGAAARPQGAEYTKYSEDYQDGDHYVPPVGSIRVGSPWPGIPIVDNSNEFANKGTNVDVAQQANPPGGNRNSRGMGSGTQRGRQSMGTTPHGSGGFPIQKNHSSTLDVSINKKYQGSSTIHMGGGGPGGGGGNARNPGYSYNEGGGGGPGGATGWSGGKAGAPRYPEYEYYEGNYPQGGSNSFRPYGAGMPIRNKFSDSPSNVNVFVRQNGGNEGFDDTGYMDPGPPPESTYNDNNDYNGNYGPSQMMPMMPFPMPIPYPMPCPCPPQCPPPPPCCCSKRKPKKKKKKKNCDKNWDMLSMYGMYSLFQQMFSSWQNQMTEQYERSRPKPPPQYGVVMGNPCQMMSMMGGGACCVPPMVMMPGLGGMMGGGGSSRDSNPIFEVTGVEVRGDANDC